MLDPRPAPGAFSLERTAMAKFLDIVGGRRQIRWGPGVLDPMQGDYPPFGGVWPFGNTPPYGGVADFGAAPYLWQEPWTEYAVASGNTADLQAVGGANWSFVHSSTGTTSGIIIHGTAGYVTETGGNSSFTDNCASQSKATIPVNLTKTSRLTAKNFLMLANGANGQMPIQFLHPGKDGLGNQYGAAVLCSGVSGPQITIVYRALGSFVQAPLNAARYSIGTGNTADLAIEITTTAVNLWWGSTLAQTAAFSNGMPTTMSKIEITTEYPTSTENIQWGPLRVTGTHS